MVSQVFVVVNVYILFNDRHMQNEPAILPCDSKSLKGLIGEFEKISLFGNRCVIDCSLAFVNLVLRPLFSL